MIHLPEAGMSPSSSNIVIAIVDTGVLMGHPDLQGQLTDDGYDFISSSSLSLDGDGIDSYSWAIRGFELWEPTAVFTEPTVRQSLLRFRITPRVSGVAGAARISARLGFWAKEGTHSMTVLQGV